MINCKNNPDKKSRCSKWRSWLFIVLMAASACLLMYIAFAKKGNLSCAVCDSSAAVSGITDSTAVNEKTDSLIFNVK